MKKEKLIEKWYNKNIEDMGGYVSKEYLDFQKDYRSVLKEIGKEIDFELISFNRGHYEFSAVMQSNKTKRYYYISISDVRYWKNEWCNDILYRTMKHENDWTGGSNCHATLLDLADNLERLESRL